MQENDSIYKVGMLCKHFKGETLLDKNIYRIIAVNVNGKNINKEVYTYTGTKVMEEATDLVLYTNIFQDDKNFAREYSDLTEVLFEEDRNKYHQRLRVQPLTIAEIQEINDINFGYKKHERALEKQKTR